MSLLIRAALYCRLSKDDELQGESSSISTQRLMLEQFCCDHHLTIAGWYIDDGYSGLTFCRPDFQRMLEDIEDGLIDIVITKDLSRLGRDYIMTGYYTDIYFSRMKVRYIAVNDEIDTAQGFSDIAPFKNILNDMYARDISRKIKSAKRQRALKGYYISGQTPYGYRVDPDDHTHLIVDTDAAAVILKIYQLAVQGQTADMISTTLSEDHIMTPAMYKASLGDNRFLRYAETGAWNRTTVSKILHDPVYNGCMVNHKS